MSTIEDLYEEDILPMNSILDHNVSSFIFEDYEGLSWTPDYSYDYEYSLFEAP